jgi:type II secretory pathway component PulK
VAADNVLTFFTREAVEIARLPRLKVKLGTGEFSYMITDEQARINVNTATRERLDRLLQCLGVEKNVRDEISDSILDWVDTNDEHRLNGAESDDHYLSLPTPYRARNGPMESVYELLQIKGVTPALFEGVGGRPGLANVLTARGTSNSVNVNTAGPVVFCAMSVSEAQMSEWAQRRREGPFRTAPTSALAGAAFTATTQTYRIEAEGLIEGRPRAAVTAVVRKQGTGAQGRIVMLEWSGVR